jgi:hypothetical protein
MLIYTYYTEETVRSTAKLSVSNVKRVFTEPTVVVKINYITIDVDKNGKYHIDWPPGRVRRVRTTVLDGIQDDNKRLFDLLKKYGVRLGKLIEDKSGGILYLVFTRTTDGSYTMSLKDHDYGLPNDIITLRNHNIILDDLAYQIIVLGPQKSIKNRNGRKLQALLREVKIAKIRLQAAIEISRGVEADKDPAIRNTRERLLKGAEIHMRCRTLNPPI